LGDFNLYALAAGLIGYLLGSIPFGLLLTRAAGVGDIRKIGSGSIGATNVLRTGRKGLAAATLLLDAGKGAVAVLIGARIVQAGPEHGWMMAGLGAMLGHLFPVWLRFKGGKGVATALGVLLAATPLVAIGCAAVWLALAWRLRISSAAALGALVAAPVLMAVLDGSTDRIAFVAVLAALIVQRHTANIKRLLAGTEPKIGQK
jgi:glycerol-3-phosphate acyltransferase PlsY